MADTILIPVTLWIIQLVSNLGYFGIFIAMTIESASIPLPSEIIMGIAGFLVYKGEMNLWVAGLAGALGNITGSTIMYLIGVKGGRPIIRKYGKYLHFDEEKFNSVDKWFSRYGDIVVFISQLLPIVRTFVSLPAGILKVSFPRFILYTFTGAFIWCTALAYVSSLFGEHWKRLTEYMKQFEIVLIAAFLGIIAYYVFKYFYKRKKQKIDSTN